jgi:hypothetical protein
MVPNLASEVLKLSALESTPGVAGDKHTLLSYGTDIFVGCEQAFTSHTNTLFRVEKNSFQQVSRLLSKHSRMKPGGCFHILLQTATYTLHSLTCDGTSKSDKNCRNHNKGLRLKQKDKLRYTQIRSRNK